jgi:thymidylate synthase
MAYRNAAEALVGELRNLAEHGAPQVVRGTETFEVRSRLVELRVPTERCIVVPHRNNDTFAAIAETMWVLAGRDDLDYLSRYLPRAPEFSDDGETWRGAYGPRLRNWFGVDQVAAVFQLLRADHTSRRAVINLFDPSRDFVQSKDVPCNNWLHFLIRDGHLVLNVVTRSNDIMWGFSGINTFEWSVLHEIMAFWLGVPAGSITYFISSLHLYDRHYARANRILSSSGPAPLYETTSQRAAFATPWKATAPLMKRWFEIESDLRAGSDVIEAIDAFPDPLLGDFLRMLLVQRIHATGMAAKEVHRQIAQLHGADHRAAAQEQLFSRSSHAANELVAGSSAGTDDRFAKFITGVVDLHLIKDEAYRNSWKKRGEFLGIMANIARKVDRIEAVAAGAKPGDEAQLDTVVDLLVYCAKYETFLADADPQVAHDLFAGWAGQPYSDSTVAVERILQGLATPQDAHNTDLADAVIASFKQLEETVLNPKSRPFQRYSHLRLLTRNALAFAFHMSCNEPRFPVEPRHR